MTLDKPPELTTPPAPIVRFVVVQPAPDDAPMVSDPPVTVESPVTARLYVPTASVPADTVRLPDTERLAVCVTVPV